MCTGSVAERRMFALAGVDLLHTLRHVVQTASGSNQQGGRT
jgi:hypothetical protein